MARKPQEKFPNGSETLKEFPIVTDAEFFLRVYLLFVDLIKLLFQ
jgi:hypothetical protein